VENDERKAVYGRTTCRARRVQQFLDPDPDPDPIDQLFLDPDPDGPDFLMICWSGLRKVLNEIFQFDSTVAPRERDTFLIIYIR